MVRKIILALLVAVALTATALSFSACSAQQTTSDDGPVITVPDNAGSSSDDENNSEGGGEDENDDGGGQTPSEPDDGEGNSEQGSQPEQPSHVHNLSFEGEAKPDCTHDGHTSYWYCSDCGKYFSDEGISEITPEDILLPAVSHDYVAYIVAPDCTEQGYTEYICDNCGDAYIDEYSYTAPLGHSFGEWEVVTAATCQSEGEKTRCCERCGAVENVVTDKLTHEYVATNVPSTCIQQGYTQYTCSMCGDSYVDNNSLLPLAPHAYGQPQLLTAPTCTTPGEQVSECTVRGAQVGTSVAPVGDEYNVGVTPPNLRR